MMGFGLALCSLLTVITPLQAAAENNVNTTQHNPSLDVLNKAFFAQFQNTLTNEVHLYSQGKLLGTAQATLTAGEFSSLSVRANDSLFNTLPVVPTVRTAIVQAMKLPLISTQDSSQQPANNSESYYCLLYCQQPRLQQVGLRYRASHLDAVLVLPSQAVRDYHQLQARNETTNFSLAGDSALLSLDVGGRGATQGHYASHDEYLNYLFHALRGRYSLTSTQNIVSTQELFASYAFDGGSLLSAGRINAQLAIPFFQEFYGLELSSENLRYPLRIQQDIIYEDYFETSTQLRIYVDDQLVTQQSVAQGYQRILATSLPAGDYEARLVFTDIYGQTREVNQRIHRSAFPTLFRRAPQWLMQAGTLNVPPEVEQKQYASLMYGQQLSDNFAGRAQFSLYDGTVLSKLQALCEYDRLLSELVLSTYDSNFHRATWSETLKRDWGRLSYQWDYSRGNQSTTSTADSRDELSLTQRLTSTNQANNSHRITAEYRLAADWWLGANVAIGRQQDKDLLQWRVHSSKSIATGFFAKPMQLYVELDYQKPARATTNTNNKAEQTFRVSVSQPFDLGRRTQLYSRVNAQHNSEDSQDKINTGLTLTSQAIDNLEQSYNVSNQWQTEQHSFNMAQRYKQEFAELNGQYRVEQACENCDTAQQYSAGLRSNLVYSAGSVSAFRPERGNSSMMIDNPSDATVALNLGSIQLSVLPHSTRAVSILPYIEYPVRYKILSENTTSDYAITPALTDLRVRPHESARVVVTQQHQQYIGLKLLDPQGQPLTMQRILVKGSSTPFMTDAQGGVVLQLLSAQATNKLQLELEPNPPLNHSKEIHCQIVLPSSMPATYYYAGEIKCEE